MSYESEITGFGDLALDFLNENMLIMFNDNAPPELAELSVLHSEQPLEQDVHVGDKIVLGSYEYEVTAIGDEANATLKSMGHCCLMFNGLDEALLPGQIELKGSELPRLKEGDYFKIYFRE